jgi:hypothetical protein
MKDDTRHSEGPINMNGPPAMVASQLWHVLTPVALDVLANLPHTPQAHVDFWRGLLAAIAGNSLSDIGNAATQVVLRQVADAIGQLDGLESDPPNLTKPVVH